MGRSRFRSRTAAAPAPKNRPIDRREAPILKSRALATFSIGERKSSPIKRRILGRSADKPRAGRGRGFVGAAPARATHLEICRRTTRFSSSARRRAKLVYRTDNGIPDPVASPAVVLRPALLMDLRRIAGIYTALQTRLRLISLRARARARETGLCR